MITKKLKEETAKQQFYQICHTIAYLHSKNVCHRDLKLENILLMEPGPNSLVKVTDFGLSKQFNSSNILESYVGTPIYMAPEVISCRFSETSTSYSCKADCWSLGVMLYMLLCGHQPFNETIRKNLFSVIQSGEFEPMTGSCWSNVTPVAKDLVRKLLDTNPVTRLSAEQVIKHEWFTSDMEVVTRAREVMGLEAVVDNFVLGESFKVGTNANKLRGEKRKFDVDKEGEDGARTIRRKARERRKTELQQV